MRAGGGGPYTHGLGSAVRLFFRASRAVPPWRQLPAPHSSKRLFKLCTSSCEGRPVARSPCKSLSSCTTFSGLRRRRFGKEELEAAARAGVAAGAAWPAAGALPSNKSRAAQWPQVVDPSANLRWPQEPGSSHCRHADTRSDDKDYPK